MPQEIQYAELDQYLLDPHNPRLGRMVQQGGLSQVQVLEKMDNWSLEELATSFLESGFWDHEAVLCVRENLDSENRLLVIEGNRRIAALFRLRDAFEGNAHSQKWREIINQRNMPAELFQSVPYILLSDRSEVDSFLGFRHVTGIKQWAPLEKAQFIAKLIEDKELSYRNVMRRIGSKTETVKRNYIAFSIFEQMEDIERIDLQKVEKKFSVLFLSIRSGYVQDFLGIKEKFDVLPNEVKPPIAEEAIDNLCDYVRWLFGDLERSPIVTDSRDADKFARVLASEEALHYLRSIERPKLNMASVIAGGHREEIFELLTAAAFNVEESLSYVHHYAEDTDIQKIAERLSNDIKQLCSIFNLE